MLPFFGSVSFLKHSPSLYFLDVRQSAQRTRVQLLQCYGITTGKTATAMTFLSHTSVE